jgi:hypothetical protein
MPAVEDGFVASIQVSSRIAQVECDEPCFDLLIIGRVDESNGVWRNHIPGSGGAPRAFNTDASDV